MDTIRVEPDVLRGIYALTLHITFSYLRLCRFSNLYSLFQYGGPRYQVYE